MTLQDRAAAALDRTHSAPDVFDNIQVRQIRLCLARWLDGKIVKVRGFQMKTSLARAYCDCLESVACRIEVRS
jgi:hypothetical protein